MRHLPKATQLVSDGIRKRNQASVTTLICGGLTSFNKGLVSSCQPRDCCWWGTSQPSALTYGHPWSSKAASAGLPRPLGVCTVTPWLGDTHTPMFPLANVCVLAALRGC